MPTVEGYRVVTSAYTDGVGTYKRINAIGPIIRDKDEAIKELKKNHNGIGLMKSSITYEEV